MKHPFTLVQLPFPSQESPLPLLSKYYEKYFERFSDFFTTYQLRKGELWEIPLWIAHLDGVIDREDTKFIDLSMASFSSKRCAKEIASKSESSSSIFFSPLAQNLGLSKEVSKLLMEKGYRTIVGGNMSSLCTSNDFSVVYDGILRAGGFEDLSNKLDGAVHIETVYGKQIRSLGYRPRYRLLSKYKGRIPLIRINASHGCLFDCSFCGDAWSKQLHVVSRGDLKLEIKELMSTFPDAKIAYVGDKTFGQSKRAVENLIEAIKPEYGYKLIVQTHVNMITPWLLRRMQEMNVQVVEMGFETANSSILKGLNKHTSLETYQRAISQLKNANIKVILNVLGGLPRETCDSQNETFQFMNAVKKDVWLYNLYNFVPYPKTPIFGALKSRIVDWDFQNWREDRPVVFEPFFQSRESSWRHFLKLIEHATKLIGEYEEVH